jgi:hypothetical protein
VQVQADGSGNFSFIVKRPAGIGSGSGTITASEVTGLASGSLGVTYTIAATRRFDFNASDDPAVTAAGFIPVRGSNTYSATQGFGWNVAVPEFDRGGAAGTGTPALYRDGNYGSAARTLSIQVGAGSYNLRVYLGDALQARDQMQVTVEGAGAPQVVNTAAGMFATPTFTGSDVNDDGKIDMTIVDLGGDPYWVVNGIDITSGALPPQAQVAAGGVVNGNPATPLTQEALAPIVAEAIRRWSAAGLTAQQVASLQAVTFQIADLSAQGVLGLDSPGVVTLDATAAGHGWFVDPTPSDNSEFGLAGPGGSLQAALGSAAAGQMDLLTVVEHELGHELGLGEFSDVTQPGDVMDGTLGVGVRRMPTAADVDVFFGAPLPPPPSTPTPAPTPTNQPSSGTVVVATTGQQAGRRLRHVRGRSTLRTVRVHAPKVAAHNTNLPTA